MRQKIKSIAAHPLISGSFFIFSGGVLGNFFNFLFNLLMSRNLKVSEYGVLLSLVSIVTLLSIPAAAVIPTIVATAGNFFESHDSPSLKAFYFKIIKPFLFMGLGLLVISIFFSSQIASFLNLTHPYFIYSIAIIIFLAYLGSINIGFLQAKLSFKTISLTNIISAAAKVVFGFCLVILGFGINGAIGAYVLTMVVPIVVGVYVMRGELFAAHAHKIKFSYKNLAQFGIPSAIIVFCLNAYISVDIILVKHLFTPEQAGLYAGLSLIGRVIFYVTAPITTVMFPLIASRFNKKEKYNSLLFGSLGIVGAFSFFMALFYFLFPEFTVIFFLKKSEYLGITQYLGHFGIFVALYSLVFVLSYYFLSIKQTRIWKVLLSGAISQAVLIFVFHKDFNQILNVSIGVLILLLLILLYYTRKIVKSKKSE